MKIIGVRTIILGRYGMGDCAKSDDTRATSNMLEYHRQWAARNRERIRQQKREWYKSNRQKVLDKQLTYRQRKAACHPCKNTIKP